MNLPKNIYVVRIPKKGVRDKAGRLRLVHRFHEETPSPVIDKKTRGHQSQND